MVNLSSLVNDIANRSDFSRPIRSRYDKSSSTVCSTVNIFPNGVFRKQIAQLVFGPQIAVLGSPEIQSLIAHELAHHKLGHVNAFVCRAGRMLCYIRNPRIREYALSRLACLVPKKKKDEFEADAFASKVCPAEDLSVALVLLDLSWDAYYRIRRTGNCFGKSVSYYSVRNDCFSEDNNAYSQIFLEIKHLFAACPDMIKKVSEASLANQSDFEDYPCVQARLRNLGFEWQSICDLIHSSVSNSLENPIAVDL